MGLEHKEYMDVFNEEQINALVTFFESIGIEPPKEINSNICFDELLKLDIGFKHVKHSKTVEKAFLKLSQTGLFETDFLQELAGSILSVKLMKISDQNSSADPETT